ncbi:hypothetical protein JAAARDRAFT_73967 [Jaapia argillacea MUCL 33604]|uniref:F-box domain-containing protein n=1 Tax=Jaapia argillacea MUCL 33604 TaxID=933084 RepID=A0A067PK98_9AGAM|nr:hypothetical protein JAAARDRAFT_73967 [Jaapia argillacea MUCL 33604]
MMASPSPIDATQHNLQDHQDASALRQGFDCDIADLRLVLQQPCTRRNALCPLHQLPPEILGRIFELSLPKNDFPPPGHLIPLLPYRKESSTIELLRAVFNITSICHHWRTIALESPSCWNYIVPAPEECISEMLSRSTGLIEVDFMSLSPPHNRLRAESRIRDCLSLLIGSSFCRIQSLSLRVFDEDIDGLGELLGQNAPGLTSLALCFGVHLGRSTIPLISLMGHKPSLRRLVLSGMEGPWSCPSLKNLTSLFVERPWQPSSFPAIFRALESMPLLEVLRLRKALPHVPGQANEDFPREGILPVSMPALTYIHIEDEYDAALFLLNHVTLPKGPSIILHVSTRGIYDCMPDLLQATRRRLDDAPDATPFVSLGIADGFMQQVFAYTHVGNDGCSASFHDCDQRHLDIIVHPDYDIPARFDQSRPGDWTASLRELFPCSSKIRELELKNLTYPDVVLEIDDVLGQFHAAEYISVGTKRLLTSLLKESSQGEGFLLPNLKSLNFERSSLNSWPIDLGWDVLQQVVAERYFAGSPLEVLDLRGYGMRFTKQFIDDLCQHVETVLEQDFVHVGRPALPTEGPEELCDLSDYVE